MLKVSAGSFTPRKICQCRLLAVVGFSCPQLMLVRFALSVVVLGEVVEVVGISLRLRVRSSLSLVLHQPSLGAGASALRGEGGCAGVGAGQACARKASGGRSSELSSYHPGGVKRCLCSRSTGAACVSTTLTVPTATAAPLSTTTGRGHLQKTTIPTSARVRRVPFPSPPPEAFPKSSLSASNGSGSELRRPFAGTLCGAGC